MKGNGLGSFPLKKPFVDGRGKAPLGQSSDCRKDHHKYGGDECQPVIADKEPDTAHDIHNPADGTAEPSRGAVRWYWWRVEQVSQSSIVKAVIDTAGGHSSR